MADWLPINAIEYVLLRIRMAIAAITCLHIRNTLR